MPKFVYKKNQIGQVSPDIVALKFGNKDISSIADGTLTGAIFYLDALISSGEVTDGGGLIIGTINESHTSFIVDGDLIVTPSKSFIFVDMNTNVSYRWDGEKYVTMNSGILLGETSDRAFPGDRGKDLEDNKVDKIDGMGLSTNDFTDYYKKKLEGIEANANYFDSTKLSSLNLAIFATELSSWNNARDTIFNNGIDTSTFNTLDFNTITETFIAPNTIRFAYVLGRPSYGDNVSTDKMTWNFNAKGNMELMVPGEYKVALYEHQIKFTSLIDNAMLITNVII